MATARSISLHSFQPDARPGGKKRFSRLRICIMSERHSHTCKKNRGGYKPPRSLFLKRTQISSIHQTHVIHPDFVAGRTNKRPSQTGGELKNQVGGLFIRPGPAVLLNQHTLAFAVARVIMSGSPNPSVRRRNARRA